MSAFATALATRERCVEAQKQEQHQSPPRPSMNVPFGVSRETIVLMLHVIATSVSRETSRKAQRHWKASLFPTPSSQRTRSSRADEVEKRHKRHGTGGRECPSIRKNEKTEEKGGGERGKGERGERRTGCEDARKTLTATNDARKLAPRARR